MDASKHKILFCNITYLRDYDQSRDTLPPQGGGAYVAENKTGGEVNNFHPYDDGNCYGYVEPGLTNGQHNTIHIENIDENAKGKDTLSDVTVVFCATLPGEKGSVIVGWYDHATVLRRCVEESDRIYNLVAQPQNVVLLPETKRTMKAPRASTDGFGFGQNNLWYASGEDTQTVRYRNEVLAYIRQYDGKKRYFWADEDEAVYTEGAAETHLTNTVQRNAAAREACLAHYGCRCQICGFDAEKVYGSGFARLIHVHHIAPLGEQKTEHLVDPIGDLIPVCPNCHMALHTKIDGRCLSPEELRQRLKRAY